MSSTQQEILLFVKTQFSSRMLDQRGEEELQSRRLSEKEKLEEACWNGLVSETLPEICEYRNNNTLTLWSINEADSFLDLLYGDLRERGAKELSVNPYVFMQRQHYN